MILSKGQRVQRKDMHSDRWSIPFDIETDAQLHYHQSYQSMDYIYKLA